MHKFKKRFMSIILALLVASSSISMPVNVGAKTNGKQQERFLPFKRNQISNSNNSQKQINISANSTDNSITVYWDAVNKAEGYDVEADGKVINNGLNNSFVNAGLQPGTKHVYRIRVNFSGQNGPWSEPIEVYTKEQTVSNKVNITNNERNEKFNTDPNSNFKYTKKETIPETPSRINSIPTLNSIIITWNSVDGATDYEIEVDGSVKDCGSKTTYVDTGLSP